MTPHHRHRRSQRQVVCLRPIKRALQYYLTLQHQQQQKPLGIGVQGGTGIDGQRLPQPLRPVVKAR
jgi:hypothetical protein